MQRGAFVIKMTRALMLAALAVTLAVSCGEPDQGRSRLKLDSTPGSEVWLNGELLGPTPIELRVQPGTCRVVFKREGFLDYEDSFPLPASSEVEITASLIAADLDREAAFAALGEAAHHGATRGRNAPGGGVRGDTKDLLFRLTSLTAALDTFFAELGVAPPEALTELHQVVQSGKIPGRRSDREQLVNFLGGLAGAVEQVEGDALAVRIRALIEEL